MVNKFSRLLGLASALLLSATAVNAATVSAVAELRSVKTTGTLLTFTDNFFTQNAVTNLNPQVSNPGSPTPQQIILGSPATSSSASSTVEIGPIRPHTDANVKDNGSASSEAFWSFNYLPSQSGIVTVDIEYFYNASIVNLNAGESASVISNTSVTYPKADSIQKISALHQYTNQNVADSNIGHLVFDLIVGEGQIGSLTFTASSSATATTVPVPAAVWLFGSALVSMVGLRRRKA